jgi:hypothetical protein
MHEPSNLTRRYGLGIVATLLALMARVWRFSMAACAHAQRDQHLMTAWAQCGSGVMLGAGWLVARLDTGGDYNSLIGGTEFFG